MKNLKSPFSLLFGAFMVFSCEEDPMNENAGVNIAVRFETAATTVAENAGEQTVLLKLSKPAPSDGVITLKPGENFASNFNTIPSSENGLIHLAIAKGESAVVLKLLPINNTDKDGQRFLELKLHSVTAPLVSAVPGTLNITVEDDESAPIVESMANFISQNATLDEKNASGLEYQIHFSEAVAIDSEIKITLSSENGGYGVNYISEPLAQNNIISLPVAAGLRVLSFKITPIDNDQISGELKVKLDISETTGSVKKGTKVQEVLTIKDDELTGKPRGYEVTAGNTVIKRFYEYDASGRISKVNWENYTPSHTQGTDVYHYNQAGQIERITKGVKEIVYFWSGGRIVRSEEQTNGSVNNYNEYDYDEKGNVAGVVSYYRQADNTFVKGFFTLYLYFLDGNLYKSLTYQDNVDPEQEPYLVSTKTYDNYIDVVNHFPMSEVLPNIKSQTKLATVYRLEESGADQTYSLAYEFREDGLVGKRIASGPHDTQTAVYHYY